MTVYDDFLRQQNGKVTRITENVREYFGIPKSRFYSKSLSRAISVPRTICIYLLFEETTLSATQIGRIFRMSRSGASDAQKRITKGLDSSDGELIRVLEEIRSRYQKP